MTDILKIKAEDTSRNLTTTVVDDTELLFEDLEPGVYALTGYILATCTAANIDLKAGLRLPEGNAAAARLMCSRSNTSTFSGTNDYLNDAIADEAITKSFTIAANATIGLMIKGVVHIVSPGTLSFQWAQNSSSATAVTVRQGSWLRLRNNVEAG